MVERDVTREHEEHIDGSSPFSSSKSPLHVEHMYTPFDESMSSEWHEESSDIGCQLQCA